MEQEQQIKIGIGVMVMKDGKVLLGKRKSYPGVGEYSFPGGKMEYLESILGCARREVREEAGIEIENIRFLRLANLKDYPPRHYIDIALMADWKSGEAKVLEPEKCESWDWYDLNNLPEPLFAPLPSYFEALKTGRNFFDS